MEKQMKDLQIAHCDIKPANLIVDKSDHIKIIDWDNRKIYGEIRDAYTPGYNDNYKNGTERCNVNTDKKGFEYVKKAILNPTEYRKKHFAKK